MKIKLERYYDDRKMDQGIVTSIYRIFDFDYFVSASDCGSISITGYWYGGILFPRKGMEVEIWISDQGWIVTRGHTNDVKREIVVNPLVVILIHVYNTLMRIADHWENLSYWFRSRLKGRK